MAISTKELEDALAEAGISSEAAPSLAAVLQRLVDAREEDPGQTAVIAPAETIPADSTDRRLDRIEQELVHLHDLLTVRFEDVDRQFEEMRRQTDQRFDEIDRRFEEMQRQMDQRFDEMRLRTDQRFDEMQRQMDQRFGAVDDKFDAVDDRFAAIEGRFDRERRERWGIVTAATGAIVAALLRLFGVI